MKRIFFLLVFLLFLTELWAHDIHEHRLPLRHWHLLKGDAEFEGSFLLFKDEAVYIEDNNDRVIRVPIDELSPGDQQYVRDKYRSIMALNNFPSPLEKSSHSGNGLWLVGLIMLLLWAGIIVTRHKYKLRYLTALPMAGGVLVLFGFAGKGVQSPFSITDPLKVDSAFIPFKPNVYTHWDNNYFYVESKGIPNHGMMTGITAWQQQVPIPQCYTDTNAWSIPLNPVMAVTPVPVNQQHFLRGAIAVAANGIAIFNPYTNTGVDAFLDGQLDNWGGHCGRADDYHYHIAPLHLYTSGQTSPNLPVAFALDGFAVYGSMEPDGTTPMTALDANHGHMGANGVYHYHGTSGAPYMIGNMVGKVTEDSTLQIVPQAKAFPVRPSLTPLSGATITNCQPNSGGNGYTLTYVRSGQTYQVEYSWTNTGTFTYNFISPTGTTTETYVNKKGHNCVLPSGPLPLNSHNLSARVSGSKVILKWLPGNAARTHAYIVQRSVNGITWMNLGEVHAVASQNSYTYTDESPRPRNFYRLKVEDEDGKFTYSVVVTADIVTTGRDVFVYPNPAVKTIDLRLGKDVQPQDVKQLTLMNMGGEKVLTTQRFTTIDVSRLPRGAYLVNIQLSNTVLTRKLLLQ